MTAPVLSALYLVVVLVALRFVQVVVLFFYRVSTLFAEELCSTSRGSMAMAIGGSLYLVLQLFSLLKLSPFDPLGKVFLAAYGAVWCWETWGLFKAAPWAR